MPMDPKISQALTQMMTSIKGHRINSVLEIWRFIESIDDITLKSECLQFVSENWDQHKKIEQVTRRSKIRFLKGSWRIMQKNIKTYQMLY